MTEPTKLLTSVEKCRGSAIKELREALELAESGEIIACYGVLESRNGTYRHFGSATMSRLQTAGALLECAVQRLDIYE